MAAKKTIVRDVTWWLRVLEDGTLEKPTADDVRLLHDTLLAKKREVLLKDDELQRVSNELSDLRRDAQQIEAAYSSVEDAFLRGM